MPPMAPRAAAVGVFTLLFHFLKRKYGPVVIRDLSTEETKCANTNHGWSKARRTVAPEL
jgi:hypothetical protein